ncbi:MAG: Fur family transcriptional regulator [Litorimonas sp.]
MTQLLSRAPASSGPPSIDVPAALHSARTRAEGSGTRFTRSREYVYRTLLESPCPLGAYEILDRMDAAVGAQKPPTVYRALDWLLEMGLAHRIATLSKFVAAPLDAAASPVAYLLCRECGQAEPMEAGPVSALLHTAVRDAGFRNEDTVIEVTGLCGSHPRTDTQTLSKPQGPGS